MEIVNRWKDIFHIPKVVPVDGVCACHATIAGHSSHCWWHLDIIIKIITTTAIIHASYHQWSVHVYASLHGIWLDDVVN